MKKTVLAVLVFFAFGCQAERNHAAAGDAYQEPEFVEGSDVPTFYAESMKRLDERIQWWREARFGCFMHWGAYSTLGGIWHGNPVNGYAEHIQRKLKIDQATYRKEVVEQFNPVQFNADEWVRLIRDAGMRYLVITAKHHDGFAMYDSAVSDWDIVDATPFKRDPMKELKAACQKYGVRFGFYYSHAFDWGDPNGPGNDWEYQNPGGDNLLGGRQWWTDPVYGKELPRIREQYVNRKAIPQVLELVHNYQPDIMWFDTPHKLPNSENWRVFSALRHAAPNVVVNGRLIPGYGDYQTTCDKPAEIRPTTANNWEAIPTTNESYGYHSKDKNHKPVAELLQLLVKAVARGGNILMNIGPRGDGCIDDPDVAILKGFADWMKAGAESIHGAGKSGLPVQPWGESTAKGATIYLHVFDWPADGKLRVGGLKSDPSAIRILHAPGHKVPLRRVDSTTVELSVPLEAPHPSDTVIALSFDQQAETAEARLLDPVIPTHFSVFDGRIEGDKLKYGSGAKGWGERRSDCLINWTNPKDSVNWTIYAIQSGRYSVTAIYHGNTNGNRLRVSVDGTGCSASVKPGQDRTADFGSVFVETGTHQLSLQADGVLTRELARPCKVILTPESH